MNFGWRTVPIGSVAEPIERAEPPIAGKSYRQAGVRLWGEGAYERDAIDGGDTQYSVLNQLARNDIIVNKIWARNGSVSVVQPELEGCYCSTEFPIFRPDLKRLEPRWFYWITKTEWFWSSCDDKSRGTSGKNRIRPDQFLQIEIPLPPLAEQQRIVAKIERLAGKIEEARGLRNDTLTAMNRILQSAVTALRFPGNQWLSIADIVARKDGTIRSGPFGSQLTHDQFVESGVKAIGTRDVGTNIFHHVSGWHIPAEIFNKFRRYEVFPEDLLVTIVGASIGRFCVYPEGEGEAFTTKHVVAVTTDIQQIDPHYASFMLNFHRFCRESLFAQVEGSAQPSLNNSKVANIRIPVPEMARQKQILAFLHDLAHKLKATDVDLTRSSAELDALLPSILDRAFKGEL